MVRQHFVSIPKIMIYLQFFLIDVIFVEKIRVLGYFLNLRSYYRVI